MTTTLLDRRGPPVPQVDGDITRRRFVTGGLAAGLLTLAGCGRADEDNQVAPTATTRPRDAFPVTIEHRYGSTTVPAEPQRVVALGLTDVDPMLALGIKPVGFVDWYGPYEQADIRNGLWPWSHDAIGDARPTVMPGNDDTFNFETVASLRPDLIIARYTGMTAEEYGLASRIAPTVAQSAEHPDFQAPWDFTTRVIGRALGRSERAEQLIAGVKDRFAQARRRYPEFSGRTAVLVDFFGGVLLARGPLSTPGKVLAELGFGYPPEIAALIPSDKVLAELSLEQIGLLEGTDVVIMGVLAGELLTNPLFTALDVAEQGRVVPRVEPIEGALYWATVASLPFALDGLVPMLAAAVDGDPATTVAVP